MLGGLTAAAAFVTPETAAAGLRMHVTDPYAALDNVPPSLRPARVRVKPGKPRESVVWLKVTGQQKQAGIFGTRMRPRSRCRLPICASSRAGSARARHGNPPGLPGRSKVKSHSGTPT
jgi:hypothetical protein